ncbi:hypothetical protein CHT98_17530 (plasmid) [Azospirillum brasilense]|uniref:Uncharacterized protein n=1 Tax=Azospirillum brasilense TaxID=192 RepID=A0A235HBQ4_AZOBR|nr:hypothetical protein CHT98_17530 [Azospirillum brasilense]
MRTVTGCIVNSPSLNAALLTLAGGTVGLVRFLWPDQLSGRQAMVLLSWLAWAGLVAVLHRRPPRIIGRPARLGPIAIRRFVARLDALARIARLYSTLFARPIAFIWATAFL